MKRNVSRRPRFWAAALLTVCVVCEALSWLSLVALKRLRNLEFNPISTKRLTEANEAVLRGMLESTTSPIMASADLGWTLRPGIVQEDGAYRTNAQGLRSEVDTPLTPTLGRPRFAAFGDSFTYGAEVSGRDTWEERLSALEPGIEILNFGVSAYGLDQAFLRYRLEGVAYRPDVVFIGMMSENVLRHVNNFRPFYSRKTRMPLGKPRFVLSGRGLELLPNPLPTVADYRRLLEHQQETLAELARNDGHVRVRYQDGPFDFLSSVRLVKVLGEVLELGAGANRFYDGRITGRGFNPGSEAFRITVGIIETFYREALEHGSVPVVLLFPERGDLRRHRSGGKTRYAPLVELLRRSGLRCVDLLEALDGWDGPDEGLFAPDGHYGPAATLRVAGHLKQVLRRQALLEDTGILKALEKERHERLGVGVAAGT